jgi:hypothetical protein
MDLLNDRYVGIKLPSSVWQELKAISESQGYCVGSFIRSVIYKALGKINPEETSATER